MDVRIINSVLAVLVSVLATPSFGQPDTTDITYDTPPVAGNFTLISLEDCVCLAQEKLAVSIHSPLADNNDAAVKLRYRVAHTYWDLWTMVRKTDSLRAIQAKLGQIRDHADGKRGVYARQRDLLRSWHSDYDPETFQDSGNVATLSSYILKTEQRLRDDLGYIEAEDRRLYPVTPAAPQAWDASWDATFAHARQNNGELRSLTRQINAHRWNWALEPCSQSVEDQHEFAILLEKRREREMTVAHMMTDSWRSLYSQAEMSRAFKAQWIQCSTETDIYRARLESQEAEQFAQTLDLYLRATQHEHASRCNYFQAVAEVNKAVESLRFYSGGSLYPR